MAARWKQQKEAKMKRMRRAWAKPYSMKSTGISANPGFKNDQGEFVLTSIRSRAKAGGRVADPWLDAIFKDHNPLYHVDEQGNYSANEDGIYKRKDSVPRAAVLAKLMQSTNGAGTLQGEQRFVYEKILDGEFVKVRLYMSGDEAFFVEQTTKGRVTIYRRSILYGSMFGRNARNIALEKFSRKRVCWAECISSSA